MGKDRLPVSVRKMGGLTHVPALPRAMARIALPPSAPSGSPAPYIASSHPTRKQGRRACLLGLPARMGSPTGRAAPILQDCLFSSGPLFLERSFLRQPFLERLFLQPS